MSEPNSGHTVRSEWGTAIHEQLSSSTTLTRPPTLAELTDVVVVLAEMYRGVDPMFGSIADGVVTFRKLKRSLRLRGALSGALCKLQNLRHGDDGLPGYAWPEADHIDIYRWLDVASGLTTLKEK